jgi:hypothetical protein
VFKVTNRRSARTMPRVVGPSSRSAGAPKGPLRRGNQPTVELCPSFDWPRHLDCRSIHPVCRRPQSGNPAAAENPKRSYAKDGKCFLRGWRHIWSDVNNLSRESGWMVIRNTGHYIRSIEAVGSDPQQIFLTCGARQTRRRSRYWAGGPLVFMCHRTDGDNARG